MKLFNFLKPKSDTTAGQAVEQDQKAAVKNNPEPVKEWKLPPRDISELRDTSLAEDFRLGRLEPDKRHILASRQNEWRGAERSAEVRTEKFGREVTTEEVMQERTQTEMASFLDIIDTIKQMDKLRSEGKRQEAKDLWADLTQGNEEGFINYYFYDKAFLTLMAKHYPEGLRFMRWKTDPDLMLHLIKVSPKGVAIKYADYSLLKDADFMKKVDKIMPDARYCLDDPHPEDLIKYPPEYSQAA